MQIAQTAPEAIKPILRPDAVEEAKKDIRNAEAKLESPHIEDKREARNQLIRLRQTSQAQFPKPPATAEEEGRLAARSRELLDHIVSDGMLSQAEMRACPPGAPDQHLAWERRNKAFILEWKNIQLRMKPGEREAANLERYRPVASRMNLDNAVVDRKLMFNVENVTGVTTTFSDEELIALETLSPEDRARVPSMANEERAVWKKTITLLIGKAAAPELKEAAQPKPPKVKRQISPEHKAKMAAGRAAYLAKKAA